MKITVNAVVAAPIEQVWQAYTSPEAIVKWNAASEDWHTTSARVDLRVGGEFSSRMEAKDGSFGFDFAGVYTKIEAHELIEYEFGDRLASIRFITAEQGTEVIVEFDAETENPIEMQQTGWQAILNSFKAYVES